MVKKDSEIDSSEINEFYCFSDFLSFSVDLWQELIEGCLQHTERDIQVSLSTSHKVKGQRIVVPVTKDCSPCYNEL
jgi:hypothetical protein